MSLSHKQDGTRPSQIEEVGMGNQDSLLVDISNNLDDIRQELRIANQLKFLELTYRAWAIGQCDGLTDEEVQVLLDLRAKLVPIKEKA
jgi:hypothetical protein